MKWFGKEPCSILFCHINRTKSSQSSEGVKDHLWSPGNNYPSKIHHRRVKEPHFWSLALNKHGFYHWHIPCYQVHSQLSHMAAFSINCSHSGGGEGCANSWRKASALCVQAGRKVNTTAKDIRKAMQNVSALSHYEIWAPFSWSCIYRHGNLEIGN